MRIVPIAVAGLLMMTACGSQEGAPDREPPTSSSETEAGGTDEALRLAQPDADLLVDAVGDEHGAIVAVLVASDDGYSLDQILLAAPTGGLTDDGRVFADDGSPIPPELVPTDAFAAESRAGLRAAAAVPADLRSPDEVADAFYAFMVRTGQPAITTLLILIDRGYTAPQIIEALFGVWSIRADLLLYDERGRVVEPTGDPRGGYGALPSALAELVAGSPGSSEPSTGPDTAPSATGTADETPPRESSDDGSTPGTTASTAPRSSSEHDGDLAELVDRAAGVYVLTDDLAADLLSIPDAVGVNRAEGEMVIDPDGAVSGSLSWSYSVHIDLRQGPHDAIWTVDVTIEPADLELKDDGLAFTTQAHFDKACYNDSCVEPMAAPVSGFVDVELGRISVGSLNPATGGDVQFVQR